MGCGTSAARLHPEPEHSITISEVAVPVTGEPSCDISMALSSPLLLDWKANIERNPAISITSVHIQSIDMFGPRIGFMKFSAEAFVDGIKVPGIVFARGGAVAILIVLTTQGEGSKEYTVVTRQPRVPVGEDSFPEIPAGMVDGDRNFKGKAISELKEETGIDIREDNLVDLTQLAYGNDHHHGGMIPSAGGCDEFLRLFLYRANCSEEFLSTLQGRLTGLRSHGELITLEVLELDQLWRITPDAKALSALWLYKQLEKEGQLDGVCPFEELTTDHVTAGELRASKGHGQARDTC